jgi:hypothetical protein
VAIGDDVAHLSAFVMTLSHSRKPAVVWSEDKGLLSWLGCHNGAFHRLAGVGDEAQVRRSIDRLKAGAAGDLNTMPLILDAVRAYATVGEMCDALRDVWGEYEEIPVI